MRPVKRVRLLALGTAGAAAAVLAPAALGSRAPSAHSAATTVNVTATEFKFALRPTSARPGTVTFRVRNAGKVPHNFKIAGKKTKNLQPKKRGTLQVRLKKGSYTYLCTIPGHADSGMKGRFRVR